MEAFSPLWSFPENTDELKMKLEYARIELESVKMEANDQISKYKVEANHLLNLLKLAYQERDEAKGQLQKLLKLTSPTPTPTPTELPTILPNPQSESPLLIPTKANSSITESNSLTHGSSPVDSFFDAVTSPEFSSMNMSDSSNMGFLNQQPPFVQEFPNNSFPTGLVSSGLKKLDPADALLDNLIKGETLPEKGRLLQTVMEQGPLLQTLMVAGPLPRWRNPPPLQAVKIPPVSINQITDANTNGFGKRRLSQLEMSRGSAQMCSASVLNFGGSASDSGLSSAAVGFNAPIPAFKRPRFSMS